MRKEVAITKNVAALHTAFNNLKVANQSIPKMGLVHGYTGSGKTCAIEELSRECNAVFVRANSLWTPRNMLSTIMQELGVDPMNRSDRMFKYVTENLAIDNRPLFIDEVNYLVDDSRKMVMLDLLRDIHDLSQVPVLLIGHQGTERRVVMRPQLSRRLSQIVEFNALDVEDTSTLAETICECEVATEILKRLNQEAEGNAGLITLGLGTLEAFAVANALNKIEANQWAKRTFGFIKKK